MNETVPDADSGPADRLSVNPEPAAATQLVPAEVKSAIARLSWPLPGVIEIAPPAAVIETSPRATVSSEPSWDWLSAVLTPVTDTLATSKLATVKFVNNDPSDTDTFVPDTSTWSGLNVTPLNAARLAKPQSVISEPP